jgi:hypothetical protein
MKEFAFTFRGHTYRGFMAVSQEEYPHYYWCYLDDPQLVNGVGDCLSFKMDVDGDLQPSEPYPAPYHDLVQAVRRVVEKYTTKSAVPNAVEQGSS